MVSGISSLGQALAQLERIQSQQNSVSLLSTQLSTGKKTNAFSGLETDVLASQRSRAAYASLEAYNDNIANATRRIQLMSNAVQQFKDQARNFLDVVVGLSQESVHQEGEIIVYDDPATTTIETTQVGMTSSEPSNDFKLLANFSNDMFDVLFSLMNEQDGDRYLFSGAETQTQPINDTGTLDAAISTLITEWKDGNITTDDLIADLADRTTDTNTDALTDGTVGYSLGLVNGEAGNVFVRADDRIEVDYTTLASEGAFRDILVAASYFKNENLPPIADAYIDPNTAIPPFTPDVQGAPGDDLQEQKDSFFAVLNSVASSVSKALDDLDVLSFKLANAEARITEIKISHQEEQNFLQSAIADVEDVDQNDVAVKLNHLLVQIETSYAVTARVQQLSLVNFI